MEITARAPGMIILAGEHAVVHGYTAVASSIYLYTAVCLRLYSENEDSIRLQLEDVGLDFSWPIKRIKEVLSHLGSPFSSTPTLCSLETVKSITALVDEQSFPETRIGLASGVCAFLWLYISILGFKPGTVIVTSELPLGAALGSSAAYCVALSAALPAFSDSMKLDVNKWAFEEEKIIHGRPFGVDNSVSTFGSMTGINSNMPLRMLITSTKVGRDTKALIANVSARKSRHPNALCCVLNAIEYISSMTGIDSNMPLRMLITNTKVGRDTKALIANVSLRKSRHPDALCCVLNAVESISKEWSTIIQSHTVVDLSVTANEERLRELMEMNQGLLLSIGVTHASIETVLQTAMKQKLASKLTGAGGGGCWLTFTYLYPRSSSL
ncbi:hypothetical protein Goshw_008019 [Gossypium schwendimanii]|uniref:Mevalonate kinase n=1 Tax=Gossypium schwendimanii TaxID=34291 RepID=A0A7J9MYJ2_GOSSC|nr:hypothetical protein [Gossypium schwendimanii]